MIPLIAVGIAIAGLALGVAIVAGHGRRHWGRHLIIVVVLVIAALPIGAIVTLALLPFWRWLEATHALESVGHSGPADWCYLVSTVGCLLSLLIAYVVSVVRGGGQPYDNRGGS